MKAWLLRVAMIAAGLACVAGIILLVAQAPMTARYDQEAFEESAEALRPNFDGAISPSAMEQANERFFDLVDQQDTGKNLLFDTGTALLAVSLLVLTGLLARPVRRFLANTHEFWLVALASALAAAGFAGGAFLQAFLTFDRYDVPPWADSLAIPLAGAVMSAPVVFVVLILLAGLPHLRRWRSGPALLPKGVGNLLATLLYVSIAAALVWLAAMFTVEPAGWLLASATLVGAWLMLHARAVAVA